MIPCDAEKLLLFLEEEEFIVNKVKKMLYSQKVAPYVFVIPFVISLLVFWLYPLISGIVMSFQDISFGGSQWVGLKHYQKLASDKFFKTAVFNSVEYMLLTLLLLIPIPMMQLSLPVCCWSKRLQKMPLQLPDQVLLLFSVS